MKKAIYFLGLLLLCSNLIFAQTHIISATYGSNYVKKHPIAGGSGTYINLSGPGGSAFGPSATDTHLYIVWYSGKIWRYDINGANGALWFDYANNVSGSYTNYTAASAINDNYLFIGNEYNNKVVKVELNNPSNFQEFDFTGIGTGSHNNTTNFIAVSDNYIFCGGGSNLNSTNLSRCDMDGSNKVKLLDANSAIEGIAADENYVYWRDYSGNVGRASHDGSYIDKTWISSLSSGHTWGVLVDANYLYVMYNYNNLYRFNIDGTNPVDLGNGYQTRGLCFATYLTNFVWDGSTDSDWNTSSNWDIDIVPNAEANITIPDVSNNPVVNCGTNASAYNITLNSGATLTMNSGSSLTVSNAFTIQDGGSFIDNGTFTLNGSATIQKSVTDGMWQLVSSPVSGATANVFLGEYLMSYTEATDTWNEIIVPATPLNVGVGYALWGNAKGDYSFTGTPNTGDVSTSYTYTPGGNPSHYGFNLMGNPYPSGIDWDLLNETYGAIYHWDGSAYQSWNGSGTGSQYIEPMEAFMIWPGSAGTFTLSNSHRTHIPVTKSVQAVDKIIIQAGNDNYQDELYIMFNEDATAAFDLAYDAWKILTTESGIAQLYTLMDNNRMSIDQQPEVDELPLGFACDKEGTYTLKAIQNDFAGHLYLEDLQNGNVHDLTISSYTFEWNPLENEHRFNLHFSPMGIENSKLEGISVYTANKILYVNSSDQEVLTLKIHDIIGHQIMSRKLNQSVNEIPLAINPGIYLVTVSNGSSFITQKVYVK